MKSAKFVATVVLLIWCIFGTASLSTVRNPFEFIIPFLLLLLPFLLLLLDYLAFPQLTKMKMHVYIILAKQLQFSAPLLVSQC